MATHYYTPVLGRRMRVTEVSGDGAVIAGPDGSHIVTEGFVTVTLSAQVEDGVEIIKRNAAGGLCVNEKKSNEFKRFDVEIEFCGVNPSLLSYVTNVNEYEDAGSDVAGFTVPEGAIEKWFALELWTGLAGQGTSASGYFLLPFVEAGTLGEITVDGENAVTFSMTGAFTRGGNAWGVGEYDVVLDALDAAGPLPLALDPYDHLLVLDTGVAPPAAAADPVANAV